MRSSGFSLVEVLIAICLLLAVLGGGAAFMSQSSKALVDVRSISALDDLTRQIVVTIDTPDDLANTLAFPGNVALLNCAQNPATCDVSVPSPISLISASQALTRVTGIKTDPVYYSIEGKPCSGAGCAVNKFPLEAISAFTSQAGGTQIHFCIRKRTAQKDAGLSFVSMPSNGFTDVSFMPACKPFYVSQAEMENRPPVRPLTYFPESHIIKLKVGNQNCPAGHLMTGLTTDGSPICSLPFLLGGAFCGAGNTFIPNSGGNTFCALTMIDDDSADADTAIVPATSAKCQLQWFGPGGGWYWSALKPCGQVACAYACMKLP